MRAGYNKIMRALLAFILLVVGGATAADDYATERRIMVEQIGALAARDGTETSRARFDSRVMEVMASVPRHRFVPPEQVSHAYENRPLPIGHNWGGPFYGLDTTHPEVLVWLCELARTVVGWGYSYLKLDFLFAGALRGVRHDPR